MPRIDSSARIGEVTAIALKLRLIVPVDDKLSFAAILRKDGFFSPYIYHRFGALPRVRTDIARVIVARSGAIVLLTGTTVQI